MTTPSRVPPDTPAFDPARAAVFAIGIGAPVMACLLVGGPAVALFAGVGAVNALFTDPRRGVAARLISIAVAMAGILMVALLGMTLRSSVRTWSLPSLSRSLSRPDWCRRHSPICQWSSSFFR